MSQRPPGRARIGLFVPAVTSSFLGYRLFYFILCDLDVYHSEDWLYLLFVAQGSVTAKSRCTGKYYTYFIAVLFSSRALERTMKLGSHSYCGNTKLLFVESPAYRFGQFHYFAKWPMYTLAGHSADIIKQ